MSGAAGWLVGSELSLPGCTGKEGTKACRLPPQQHATEKPVTVISQLTAPFPVPPHCALSRLPHWPPSSSPQHLGLLKDWRPVSATVCIQPPGDAATAAAEGGEAVVGAEASGEGGGAVEVECDVAAIEAVLG